MEQSFPTPKVRKEDSGADLLKDEDSSSYFYDCKDNSDTATNTIEASTSKHNLDEPFNDEGIPDYILEITKEIVDSVCK